MKTKNNLSLPAVGQLPPDWTARRLRFDACINPKKSKLEMRPEDHVSFVPMEAVGEYGGLNLNETRELREVYHGYTFFENGDICIAKITPCFENGKGALANKLKNGVGFGTTELHVVRAGPNIHPKFLFYVSISGQFRKIGEAEMYGAGGQKRVDERFIKDWMLPLPPKDTQLRTVKYLDNKTVLIRNLIENKKKILNRLTELHHATITNAVTKGIDARNRKSIDVDGHKEKHRAVLHPTLPLKRLMKPVSPGAVAIKGYQHGLADDEGYPGYSASGQDVRLPNFQFEKDGLVLSAVGAQCGKCFYAKGQWGVVANTQPFLCTDKGWPKFLYYVVNQSDFWVIGGTAQPYVQVQPTMAKLVPAPTLDTQRQIAQYLDDKTAQFDSISSCIEHSISLLYEYRSALITAAVTGQISELL